MGIFKQFIEDSRRITAAKGRIADNKVVMLSDFHVEAFNPILGDKKRFVDLFGKDGLGITAQLSVLRMGTGMPAMKLPYLELKEQSKANLTTLAERGAKQHVGETPFFRAKANDVSEVEGLVRQARNAGGFIVLGGGDGDDSDAMDDMVASMIEQARNVMVGQARENILDTFKRSSHHAYDVTEISAAMMWAGSSGLFHGLARFENLSAWHGDQHVVADFWEAVADLPDYSGSFPDRRPPKGDNSKKKKFSLPKDLQGGFRPVDVLTATPVRAHAPTPAGF